MGQTVEIPFATQEATSSVLQNSQETLINMFVEVEADARRKVTRRQRAALDDVLAITGTARCIEKHKGLHYIVIDNHVYSFDGTALSASLFTLGATLSADRCSMVFNDNDDILVSTGSLLFCQSAGAVTTPTAAGHVAFLSGYAIYTVPNEQQFYVSALNDFTTWDALDFASAESNSDALLRPFTDHGELWLFGEQSIEVWGLSGGTDFPFSPLSNAKIQRGTAAAFSIAAGDNSLFWLGDDLIVYRANGYQPQRISTHSIERLIEAVPDGARALADATFYTQGGHKFYTLKFPGYLTIQFNVATGLWNRASTYPDNLDWSILGSAGGEADYVVTSDNICRLDGSINTDEGGTLLRKAISAPIWADGKRVSLRSFFADVEVGRAAISVTDPQIMLRYAPDGETFGNTRSRSLGNIGEYSTRVIWRNVGFGRRGTIELSCSDDVSLKIVGTDANITVANS